MLMTKPLLLFLVFMCAISMVHAVVITNVVYHGVTLHPKYASSWASYLPNTVNNSLPLLCLHGSIITDYYGKQFCGRKYNGQELQNRTAYYENLSLSNTTNVTVPVFYYWKQNCTQMDNLSLSWDTPIVTSSHPLTCYQIQHWVNS